MKKKSYLSLLLLAISFCSHSQKGDFQFRFTISGLDPIYEVGLETASEKEKHKSSIIVFRKDSTTFIAKGKLDYPCPFRIVIKKRKVSRWFFLEPGNSSLTVNFDSLYTYLKVTGSNTNELFHNKYITHFYTYKKQDDEWWLKNSNLKNNLDALNQVIVDSMTQARINLDFQKDSLLETFVRENPKSFVGLWRLNDFFIFWGYSEKYLNAFNLLDKKIKKTFDGSTLKSKLFVAKKLSIGSIFPNLVLLDSINNKQQLSSNISNYTLIDFWFSNCYPCIEQFPDLKKIYTKYADKGFKVIGISTDKIENRNKWLEAVSKYELSWLNLWDKGGVEATKFYIQAFPTNYLVDKSGKIIQRNIRLEELNSFLMENLH